MTEWATSKERSRQIASAGLGVPSHAGRRENPAAEQPGPFNDTSVIHGGPHEPETS